MMETSVPRSIPSLDFSLYLNGNYDQRTAFSAELVSAFQKFGFVKITNHGIENDTIQKLFDLVCSRVFRMFYSMHRLRRGLTPNY